MREPDIISNMKETSTQLSHVEKLKQQQDHSNKNELNGHKTETTTTTAVSTTTTTCLMNGATPATFGDCKLMLKSNINVLKCNNQIKELHTVIRDKLELKYSVCSILYMIYLIGRHRTVTLNSIPIVW